MLEQALVRIESAVDSNDEAVSCLSIAKGDEFYWPEGDSVRMWSFCQTYLGDELFDIVLVLADGKCF